MRVHRHTHAHTCTRTRTIVRSHLQTLATPLDPLQCPICARRIWHPEWPSDVNVLERAWANEQVGVGVSVSVCVGVGL